LNDYVYPELPWLTILLNKRLEFLAFVNTHPQVQTILSLSPCDIIACDIDTKAHLHTVDSQYKMSFFHRQRRQWYCLWRMTGQDHPPDTWKIVSFRGMRDHSLPQINIPIDQGPLFSQQQVADFIHNLLQGKTLVAYGPRCEETRLNNWMRMYNLPMITYGELGQGCTYNNIQGPQNRYDSFPTLGSLCIWKG